MNSSVFFYLRDDQISILSFYGSTYLLESNMFDCVPQRRAGPVQRGTCTADTRRQIKPLSTYFVLFEPASCICEIGYTLLQ